MQDEPSLTAVSRGAGTTRSSSVAAEKHSSLLRERTEKSSSNMSRLSAKVDSDRAKGGVSKAVYTGYLRACGMSVVSLALAISLLAQVGCVIRV